MPLQLPVVAKAAATFELQLALPSIVVSLPLPIVSASMFVIMQLGVRVMPSP